MSSVEERKKVMERLGNRCQNPNCQWVNLDGSRGCADIRCLQVDNIKGDGVKGWDRYIKMLKDPTFADKYQLLCANCNWIKRVDNQEGKQPLKPKETRYSEGRGWEIKLGNVWVPFQHHKKEILSPDSVLAAAIGKK